MFEFKIVGEEMKCNFRVFIRLGLCSISGPPLWRDMGYKTFQTRPPLPSYISPWRQHNFLFRGCRTTVLCQNGSDNNYRTKPTSAWALVANGMNFELLFTTEVIPPSRWVSNSSCKRGLGRNRQSIPSITHWRYYNVCNWQPETFFKVQRAR